MVLAVKSPEGVEIMRPEPGDAAEEGDDERRYGPDDQLEMAREGPIRPIMRARVRGAEPPGETERRRNHRHHDHQQDRERVEQDQPLGLPDRAMRIEHAAA